MADNLLPPPPPPLPPLSNKDYKLKVSVKTRDVPPDWFHNLSRSPPSTDPPTGPYFFYGTLMDPKMLMEILKLENPPILRPAKIIGYECKLWGQYPAIIDGQVNNVVHGAAYDVQTVDHAKRLAIYETRNYETKPCLIIYTDGLEPMETYGNVFTYAGRGSDLVDGKFNLDVWLRRVGR